MKILIAYYTLQGNTERVALAIKEQFERRGHTVDMERIRPARERSFFRWYMLRHFRGECDIRPPEHADVSEYDRICIGSPNWTRLALPVARYIETVQGLDYKLVGFFATTAGPPPVEWYFFSAYLLDMTFSRRIEKRGARIAASILLSSLFTRWQLQSPLGSAAVRRLCEQLEAPLRSLKDYMLRQKEIHGVRISIVLFSLLLFFSLLFQIVTRASGNPFLTWPQFAAPAAVVAGACFALISMVMLGSGVFLGKYVAGAVLAAGWSLVVYFLKPMWGATIVSGYVFGLIVVGFFRSSGAVLFSGLLTLGGYGLLAAYGSLGSVLNPASDCPLMVVAAAIISMSTSSLQRYTVTLFGTQDKLEVEKAELKHYQDHLEELVGERTAEVERARDNLDGIVKSIADGVVVTDASDRVILMNQAAVDLLGVRLSDVIDRPMDEAIEDPALRERLRETLEKKTSGTQFDVAIQGGDTKPPRILRARTSLIHSRDGAHGGIVTIISDVTEEREVDRMKTEFISTAAHELRTPLTSIQGFSEILLTRKEIAEVERERFLTYINKQAEGLANIIGDLLDISRIESRRGFTLNKIRCNDSCIREVVPYFSENSPRHRFEVVLPEDPVPLYVDKEKMQQALKNIVSNAVKYSPDGGPVRVVGEPRGDYYQVSVEDNGIGMSSAQVARIFDKFYRADSVESSFKGTGLGMSIVKYIVEAHGGRIWVQSRLGKGTLVQFTIPLERGPNGEEHEQ